VQTPEPIQNDYIDEPFSINCNDLLYGKKCKNKVLSIMRYIEAKADWSISNRTLRLLAADLGVIVDGIRVLQETDVEKFKQFAAREFKKDGAGLFINHLKEARSKLGEVADHIELKRKKTKKMMDIMQYEIPFELSQALTQFRASSGRRRQSR
jgi:hypothetical protein